MKKSIFAIMMALVLSIGCLAGCGQSTVKTEEGAALASGGVLVLSVNPEIAVEYDENGIVTGVISRNDDALAIVSECEGLIGKEAREAVAALVTAIGNAGYFVEEVEGERRQITLEIEEGSKLPNDTFLDEVIADIRDCVNENKWNVPMEVENESDYGMSDFVDTDYETEIDAATDYDDTDYGPNNDGVTDFDAATDYDDTDYGTTNNNTVTNNHATTNSNASTDYNTTDYNTTDYDTTDYETTDYEVTDYDEASDYDDSDYDN